MAYNTEKGVKREEDLTGIKIFLEKETDRRTEKTEEQKMGKNRRGLSRNGRNQRDSGNSRNERNSWSVRRGKLGRWRAASKKNFAGWEKSVNLATYKLNQWLWPCV